MMFYVRSNKYPWQRKDFQDCLATKRFSRLLDKANQSNKVIFKVRVKEPGLKLLFTIYFASLSMKALLEQFHCLKRLL